MCLVKIYYGPIPLLLLSVLHLRSSFCIVGDIFLFSFKFQLSQSVTRLFCYILSLTTQLLRGNSLPNPTPALRFRNRTIRKDTRRKDSRFYVNNLFLFAGKISHPIRTLTTSQTTYNSTTAPSTVGESQTTVKPRGAALAGVLKVGDRVRRGPDWNLFRTEVGLSHLPLRRGPKENPRVQVPFRMNMMTL